jgi:hypothetical protein
MDVVLRTNAENTGLNLRCVELYRDGSGGGCLLEVKSGPFAAKVQFFFDAGPWRAFLRDLDALNESLSGEAKLGLDFEEPFIAFRGDGRGHIQVSGLLIEHSAHSQRLEFSFVADQTALAPFLSDLREVARAPAA